MIKSRRCVCLMINARPSFRDIILYLLIILSGRDFFQVLIPFFFLFATVFLQLVDFDGLTLNNMLTLILYFFNTIHLSRNIKITDNLTK